MHSDGKTDIQQDFNSVYLKKCTKLTFTGEEEKYIKMQNVIMKIRFLKSHHYLCQGDLGFVFAVQ